MKYSKIEFGISVILFLVFLFGSVFGRASFEYMFPRLLVVCVTYGAFLTLNYYVWPKHWLQKKYAQAISLTIAIYSIVGLTDMVFYSYLRVWEYDHSTVAQANLFFFSYGFIMASAIMFTYIMYVAIREGIKYQYKLSRGTQSLQSRVAREIILVCSIWAAVLLPLVAIKGTGLLRDFGPFYFFVLPYCFIIYFLNLYWLIPDAKKETPLGGFGYFLKLTATVMLVGMIEMAFLVQFHSLPFFGHLFINWFVPTLITVAITWWVYLGNKERYEQLTSLQTALGTSNATLQYLRSQINPHFLFNALNTLYGTALMEQADKTGEGIQKLGDMMRFMLHENNLDKIALSREIEYLNNYIDLQNMRMVHSPDIVLDIQIEDIVGYYEIAPMLLIPFVENAYKHGISLQAKSWINVSLFKRDNVLHLDVYNSIHPVNENDPERYQSGTGLDNVKQRLQLLYPQKHELMVRQTAREFFIHLSVTLDTQKAS